MFENLAHCCRLTLTVARANTPSDLLSGSFSRKPGAEQRTRSLDFAAVADFSSSSALQQVTIASYAHQRTRYFTYARLQCLCYHGTGPRYICHPRRGAFPGSQPGYFRLLRLLCVHGRLAPFVPGKILIRPPKYLSAIQPNKWKHSVSIN